MRVSILGDLFVTNEVLQRAFEDCFADSGLEFQYNYLTDTWPVTPVMKTDEISEFVGDDNELCELIVDTEIILTHTAPISKKVISAAKNLKIVGAARGGPTNINWNACTSRGIPVLYAPGRNSGAVAEFAIGLMLAQSRSITRSHMSLMLEKKWRGDLYVYDAVGNELGSSVVGLVGLGAIGGKVAKLLKAFGAKVLVYDPYLKNNPSMSSGYELVELETLLRNSDFISLHARLTAETEGIIGADEISRMKPGVYIINTARGELIDHGALYEALKDRRIAGAALDIFESEPPPEDSPLFTLENVTATTHLGGASIQAAEIGAKVLCNGIHEYMILKKPAQYCVNPEVYRKKG